MTNCGGYGNINKAGGADLSKAARGPMRLPHDISIGIIEARSRRALQDHIITFFTSCLDLSSSKCGFGRQVSGLLQTEPKRPHTNSVNPVGLWENLVDRIFLPEKI